MGKKRTLRRNQRSRKVHNKRSNSRNRRSNKKRSNSRNKRSNSRNRRSNRKRSNRKRSNRNNTRKRRTNKKVIYQDGGEINEILEDILGHNIIPFLPNSTSMKDYKKYIKMMSLITLQKLIDKESKFKKSPTIQKIFNYSSEQLKLPDEIELDWKNIVCKDLFSIEQDHLVKELFLYILDCNVQKEINEEDIEMDYVLKNKRWFDICIGIDDIDPTFKGYVDDAIKSLEINLNYKNIIEKIKTIILKPDVKMELEKILKNRLMSCSKNPRTLIDKIFNTISFNSNQKCDKKKKDTVLYLYEDYKGFLNMEIEGLSKLEKTAILIFCEERQHILSKYISIEVVRQRKNNTSQVKSILSSIYKEDKDIIKKNDEQLEELNKEKTEEKEESSDGFFEGLLTTEEETYGEDVPPEPMSGEDVPPEPMSGEDVPPEPMSGEEELFRKEEEEEEEKPLMFGGMWDEPIVSSVSDSSSSPGLDNDSIPLLNYSTVSSSTDQSPSDKYDDPFVSPNVESTDLSSTDLSSTDLSSTDDPFVVPSSTDEPVAVPKVDDEPVAVPKVDDEPVAVPTVDDEPVAVPTVDDEPVVVPTVDYEPSEPVAVPTVYGEPSEPVAVPTVDYEPEIIVEPTKPLLERKEEDSGKLIISGILEKCGQLRDDINKKNYLTKEDLHHISDCDEKNIPII
jgi:hypothetical protein